MAEETIYKFYLKYLFRSKSALAAIVVILFFVGLAVYVDTWPKSVSTNYLYNTQYYENTYPEDAAPSWMAALEPSQYSPSLYLNPKEVKLYGSVSSSNIYEYELTFSFDWSSEKVPTNVVFVFSANTTMQTIQVLWKKPSGSQIMFSQTPSVSKYSFDLSYVTSALLFYVLQKTGQVPMLQTTSVLATALFSNFSEKSAGPAEKGIYTVTVLIGTSGPAKFYAAQVRVLGNAYGLMGTDGYGRPILQGILLGLPNALEIGVVTSLLGVLIGVFIGGFAGFLGGKAGAGLNWFSTVILALPALPFLVTLSIMLKSNLTIMSEVLLITFLRWPHYAIIARTSAQSIRTNTFVEADRLMGIPSYRTFFTHFLPRLVPFIVAYTVLGIPGAIILVQALAFIGVAPPNIVTWGGILDAAYNFNAALSGWWWWMLFPGLMIVVVAVPFVIVGFVIERAAFGGR